ncbi:hypothetical protein EB001_20740 [bacterium]|nr:hypothetical protein [bacterium]
MMVDTLVLILVGWVAIITYKFIRYEKDMALYQARLLQLMARTNMLTRNGKPMTKKEAMRIADEMFDLVEGKDDES